VITISDGSIKIDITIDNKPVDNASKSLDGLEDSGAKAGKGVKQTEDGLKGVGEESTKAGSNIKKFVTALGLVAVGAAAFKVLRASMDDAISRFDTLNQFPKVMEQVGFGAEESERAIRALADGIDGLPSKLDDVTSTAQQIAVMTGDLDGAVDTTLALNNAFMASGASAADAQRGLQQYVQMLAKGEVDLQSWRTLQETMGVALNDVADAFGYAGASAQNDLYDALKSGDVTFNDFNAKLIELSNETGGFADRAKTASSGIATSLSNLRYAVAIGIASMIDSFSRLSQQVTGKDLAQNLDSLKVVVNAAFAAMGNAIESAAPYVIGFTDAVGALMPVVQALSPVLIGMATAYAMHVVIAKTVAALQVSKAVTLTVTAAKSLYTIAVTKNSISLMANAASSKILAASRAVMNALTLTAVATELLLTRQITLGSAAKLAGAVAARIFGAALRFMMGPIGWVTVGIGALVGATIAVVKWFKRSSEEADRLNEETEELSDSNDALVDSIDKTSEAYKENQSEINNSAKVNEDYAKKIDELSGKENKSAADKALLSSYVDELNGSVEGLNLTYDEEADALSESSDKIQARIELMKEQELAQEAQTRLTEIIKEQEEIEAQLIETINKRKEAEDNSNISKSDAAEITAGLTEEEKALEAALKDLAEQQGITEEQIVTAKENSAAAIEEGNLRQITSYEDLEGAHKEAFDSMKNAYDELVDNATNAFDRMDKESKVSGEEMIANLEHNQEMTAQWADNVAELMEGAGEEGNEGFLRWLETMGPDSAAELAVVSDMGGDELDRFKELMNDAPKEAADNLKTSLGGGLNEAVDLMVDFADDASSTLREEIEAADFESIGGDLTDGVVVGVDGGSVNVQNAVENMADDTTKATKAAFDINSPSKVFQDMGDALTDGLALGINDGTSKVVQAIQKMFDSVERDSANSFKAIVQGYNVSVKQIETALNRLDPITQSAMSNMLSRLRNGTSQQLSLLRVFSSNIVSTFNNTPSQFRSIGVNSMLGLNQGLLAGRGRVMSTARSIANSVASTMERALKIQSPSKVLEGVGKFTGEGFVVGIESMKKRVMETSKSMAETAIPEPNWLSPASPRVKSSEKTKRNAENIMELFYSFKGALN